MLPAAHIRASIRNGWLRRVTFAAAGISACVVGCSPQPSSSPTLAPVTVGTPLAPSSATAATPRNQSNAADDSKPCVLHARGWDHNVDLLTPADARGASKPIGTLEKGPKVELTIPIHEGVATASLTARGDKIEIHGLVARDDAKLHLRRGMVLENVWVLKSKARVSWKSGSRREVRIAYELDDILTPDRPLDTRVACRDLSLNPGSYVAQDAVPLGDPADERPLRRGQPIPLAVEPGSAPAVTFQPHPDSVFEVEVHERRGPFTRVLLELDEVYLFGWVPSSLLSRANTPRFGIGMGLGGLGLSGTGSSGVMTRRVCPHEIALHARLEDEQVPLGRMLPGAEFIVRDKANGIATVDLYQADWLVLKENVAITIDASKMQGCGRTKH